MKMTRQQIDRLIDEHFGYEAADDVPGVMTSLTHDARHEIIPSPYGELSGHERIRGMYESLFRDLKGEGVTPLRRLYGDGFMVDEAVWHGHVADGRQFHLDGRSGRASFRLLHIFEFRDGKIAREDVWCDLAAIQRQLGCAPEEAPAAASTTPAAAG